MGGTASKLNTADAQPDPERSPADDDVSVYQCNLQQLLIYYYSVIPYYNNRMHNLYALAKFNNDYHFFMMFYSSDCVP